MGASSTLGADLQYGLHATLSRLRKLGLLGPLVGDVASLTQTQSLSNLNNIFIVLLEYEFLI